MYGAFKGATAFSHTLCWEVLYSTDTTDMFTNSGGGSVDPSCVYQCNPKTESEWAALGCMVGGTARGITRADLGAGTFHFFLIHKPQRHTNLFLHFCTPFQ